MANKIKLTFKGKVWKTGCSYVITVPMNFIKHGMVNIKKKQEVSIQVSN